ncbi:hypothetical protein TRFO_18395 [Tritrichomonas foetus]|uniref:Homeobox domain-containing protein n=1 Tax=Tritrichomonas foetus TaxID=1144522 RepID=A0A1J4KKU8_9EUKA|nr:hypothetical protein TRFO_18395 [Tritrichomonas foetus]|eukprot:OHT11929.1 hypothetical protein TRFO_18395 [Tritrichomonas foetus]
MELHETFNMVLAGPFENHSVSQELSNDSNNSNSIDFSDSIDQGYKLYSPLSTPQNQSFIEDGFKCAEITSSPKECIITQQEKFSLVDNLQTESSLLDVALDIFSPDNTRSILSEIDELTNVQSIINTENHPAHSNNGQVHNDHLEEPNYVQIFGKFLENTRKDKHMYHGITIEARDEMCKWLYRNIENPYPSRIMKEYFCTKYDMPMSKVQNFFMNARKRILKRHPKKNFAKLLSQFCVIIDGKVCPILIKKS